MPKFLTAEWHHLLMVNYAVEPYLLAPFLPKGLELDLWQGKTLVSMVGFLFLNTKVKGIRIPWHGNFEEVNLRFYVKRSTPEGWRRGVVFVREIVPRRLIATVARVCYNEPYVALPMRHTVDLENGSLHDGSLVEYSWRWNNRWNSLGARISGPRKPIAEGSEEEFITEHYWGYTAQRNGACKQYQVEHPRWNAWPVRDVVFDCDVASLYGTQFVKPLGAMPQSAFVAEGSAVAVYGGSLV